MTTRCHSVRSRRSPEVRSRQLSEVARFRLAMRVPSLVERISGSRPRLPTRITLLTLPAMGSLSCEFAGHWVRTHLIKPGGCSYFILIPAIHRVSTHLTLAPGRPGEDNALTRRTQRDTPRTRSGFGSAGLVHNEAARQ